MAEITITISKGFASIEAAEGNGVTIDIIKFRDGVDGAQGPVGPQGPKGDDSDRFKGEFISKAALDIAFPDANVGDYANVDAGAGNDVERYVWDDGDVKWVLQLGESTILTNAQIKTQYEANTDTNEFSDSEKTKLGIAIITNTVGTTSTPNAIWVGTAAEYLLLTNPELTDTVYHQIEP